MTMTLLPRSRGPQEKMPLAKRYEGTIHAPEFPEKLEWINTRSPVSLSDLNGRLVILHFWTYC